MWRRRTQARKGCQAPYVLYALRARVYTKVCLTCFFLADKALSTASHATLYQTPKIDEWTVVLADLCVRVRALLLDRLSK